MEAKFTDEMVEKVARHMCEYAGIDPDEPVRTMRGSVSRIKARIMSPSTVDVPCKRAAWEIFRQNAEMALILGTIPAKWSKTGQIR